MFVCLSECGVLVKTPSSLCVSLTNRNGNIGNSDKKQVTTLLAQADVRQSGSAGDSAPCVSIFLFSSN